MSRKHERMGQHQHPTHIVAHLSDTHLLSEGRLLFGRVDTESNFRAAVNQLEVSAIRPDAIVLSGDIADKGEPDAYRRARAIVDPAAARMGSVVIWAMGNHDSRVPFRTELLSSSAAPAETAAGAASVDQVFDINGLRIISLDTSVPGFHHGEIEAAQLAWLKEVLAEPSPHGTLLALHHPPIPTPVAVMDILELADQDLLAEAIRGTDVRAILAGHVHYSTCGTCGGAPVYVAGATSYTMDLSAPVEELHGVDGGQAFNLIHVHTDQVVQSSVPVGSFEQVSGIGAEFLARMRALDERGRKEAFSKFPDGT